jgi:hypothetical protein
MPIPGLDVRGVTPELKQRLKFYWSWTWWFFLFVCFFKFLNFLVFFLLFVSLFYHCGLFISIFIPIFFFFLSILSTSPSSSSHPYSQLLHSSSFSWANIHCSPSQLLFLSLLILSFPLPTLSLPIFLKHVTRLAPHTHTHHLLTNLLYQLYTTLTPCNPWHSTLQYNNRSTPKHTQGRQKQQPLHPLTHPTSCLPF